jgi:hypothetical protein
MKTNYDKLPELVEISGTGIPLLTAKLIKRTEDKAIYYRWDNIWEVFRVKIKGEGQVFGKTYPRREVYPGNEDFGVTAWCYREEKNAEMRYNNI